MTIIHWKRNTKKQLSHSVLELSDNCKAFQKKKTLCEMKMTEFVLETQRASMPMLITSRSRLSKWPSHTLIVLFAALEAQRLDKPVVGGKLATAATKLFSYLARLEKQGRPTRSPPAPFFSITTSLPGAKPAYGPTASRHHVSLNL